MKAGRPPRPRNNLRLIAEAREAAGMETNRLRAIVDELAAARRRR